MRFIGYTGVVCVLLIAAAATGAVGAAVERTAPDQLREYVRHATELAEATPAQPWPEDVPKPAHIVENEAGLTDDVVVSTKNGQVKGYTSFGTTYFHSSASLSPAPRAGFGAVAAVSRRFLCRCTPPTRRHAALLRPGRALGERRCVSNTRHVRP